MSFVTLEKSSEGINKLDRILLIYFIKPNQAYNQLFFKMESVNMTKIIIKTAFVESVEKWMSGDETPIYKYSCRECNAGYITDDRNLKYCITDKCINKDHYLSGPFLFED